MSFLKEAFSEAGTPSIKRLTLAVLLAAFLTECFVDVGWGKLMSDTLRDQLYYAFLATLGAILGMNILNGIKDIKIAQSNNNAAVGAPSPPPAAADTTIVTKP
jgi:hypothetical protein